MLGHPSIWVLFHPLSDREFNVKDHAGLLKAFDKSKYKRGLPGRRCDIKNSLAVRFQHHQSPFAFSAMKALALPFLITV